MQKLQMLPEMLVRGTNYCSKVKTVSMQAAHKIQEEQVKIGYWLKIASALVVGACPSVYLGYQMFYFSPC